MMVLALTFALVTQQVPIKPKEAPANALSDTNPVDCAEASEVFKDARLILGHALHTTLGQTSITSSSSPVSREQVVSEMTAITESMGPKIKFTPRPQGYSTAVFRIKGSQEHNLESLVKYGYVGKVSPLATGPKDTLTLKQFGDALGLFLSRASEVTHMPLPKWTPILGAGRS